MTQVDETDLKILKELQTNGRLTNIEIADRIHLSHSSCSRRISRMQKEGVIKGYRALIDRQKIGLTVRAFCGVIRDKDVYWADLANDLAKINGVISVYAVSGEVELMLEIVCKDMEEYSKVILKEIARIKGVNGSRSSFVLEEVKSIY